MINEFYCKIYDCASWDFSIINKWEKSTYRYYFRDTKNGNSKSGELSSLKGWSSKAVFDLEMVKSWTESIVTSYISY